MGYGSNESNVQSPTERRDVAAARHRSSAAAAPRPAPSVSSSASLGVAAQVVYLKGKL
jgi:hypothetical protein